MIFEKNRKKRWSMIDILKYIWDQKVKFGPDKYIPIGQIMHRIFNCIDDIIVNTEVEMDIGAGVDKSHLNWFYKYNLFADMIEQQWWDYIVNQYWLKFVGKWNGTHSINDSDEVDYSTKQLSSAFPDFLLRSFMVPDQHISLPENVENIFFPNGNRKQRMSWKRSVKQMKENMNNYFNEVNKSDDPKIQERLSVLKWEYLLCIHNLEELSEDEDISKLIQKSIYLTGTSGKFLAGSINLIDIVKLFLLSSGKEKENHALDISPWLRYEIYKKLFLVLQKWFILMDLLTQDIKEWEWEWEWKWEWKWEWEWEWKPDKWSWSSSVHVSPDIADKIKFLEELDEENEKKTANELIKKEVEKRQFDLTSILEWSWVWQKWIDTLNHITNKYADWIKEIVNFFLQELKKLDTVVQVEEYSSKKWRLNIPNLMDYIAKDPSLSDIEKQRFYNRKEHIEKISETLKKIDLTLAVDVSGSTEGFRWPNGMINIISTILFVAMKHLQSHISNLLQDPNYKIPVNFVLYGDDAPYSSYASDYANSSEEIRMAEMNQQLLSLSGWTNDTTAWQKITYEFNQFLESNPDYVWEIKNWQRKPIVVQIADSDVSESWVEVLKSTFNDFLQDEKITNSLPKRIILWTIQENEMSSQEYLELKASWQLWNWDPEFLPNGKIKLKQIWVRTRNDIVWQIKALFDWFFDDMNIKT